MQPAVSSSVIVLIVHLKDKLTAELPRSREDGAPLPKVAAHVTGGGVGSSFTEPPAADGKDAGGAVNKFKHLQWRQTAN